MPITRWRPSTGLIPRRLFRELEEPTRIFNRSLFPTVWRRFPALEKEWMPAIEMYEEEGKYVVKAELPGMKEEDIDVSVTDDTLTIKGERKAENETTEENYYRSESSYGSFFRTIALPSNVDGEKIDAHYENGVLEVSLPKVVEAKPKKVKVTNRKKEKPAK